MRVLFLGRQDRDVKWGGDQKALLMAVTGLQSLGIEAEISADPFIAPQFDFTFLTNTAYDLRPAHYVLEMQGVKCGLIGFHEDLTHYVPYKNGFFIYLQKAINGECDVNNIFESCEVIERVGNRYHFTSLINVDVMARCSVCLASSRTEAETLARDCPEATIKTVHWAPGFAEGELEVGEEFLKLTGLQSQNYILQVGRFEPRKNQLATIVATKDLEIPLVFIATMTSYLDYEELCLKAIHKYRKGPTLILSQLIPSVTCGNLKILQMPGKKILPRAFLSSAFAHAGIHVHPAFYELPGLVYLESARHGTATVASKWASIGDYFVDEKGNEALDGRISYVLPHDVSAIKKAVLENFGKRYDPHFKHPSFERTSQDVGAEILQALR